MVITRVKAARYQLSMWWTLAYCLATLATFAGHVWCQIVNFTVLDVGGLSKMTRTRETTISPDNVMKKKKMPRMTEITCYRGGKKL